MGRAKREQVGTAFRAAPQARGTAERKDRNYWRSAGAVLGGLVTIFVTHMGMDYVMDTTGVFPPYGEPMIESGQFAIALGRHSRFRGATSQLLWRRATRCVTRSFSV